MLMKLMFLMIMLVLALMIMHRCENIFLNRGLLTYMRIYISYGCSIAGNLEAEYG